jgi:hypothetical protein
MELVFNTLEKVPNPGAKVSQATATVVRGKVTETSPSFAWAVGEGIHVLLSYCARQKIRWWRLRRDPKQLELAL